VGSALPWACAIAEPSVIPTKQRITDRQPTAAVEFRDTAQPLL
jgi:hypothetical protein